MHFKKCLLELSLELSEINLSLSISKSEELWIARNDPKGPDVASCFKGQIERSKMSQNPNIPSSESKSSHSEAAQITMLTSVEVVGRAAGKRSPVPAPARPPSPSLLTLVSVKGHRARSAEVLLVGLAD